MILIAELMRGDSDVYGVGLREAVRFISSILSRIKLCYVVT